MRIAHGGGGHNIDKSVFVRRWRSCARARGRGGKCVVASQWRLKIIIAGHPIFCASAGRVRVVCRFRRRGGLRRHRRWGGRARKGPRRVRKTFASIFQGQSQRRRRHRGQHRVRWRRRMCEQDGDGLRARAVEGNRRRRLGESRVTCWTDQRDRVETRLHPGVHRPERFN